jgi:spermidine synthase
MSAQKTQFQSLNQPSVYWLLAGLYGISGLTSVAYEVLWVRMLSLQFGVSVFAVVITVVAFMVGLGAGSLTISRKVHQIRRPLVLLAIFEGSIAVYALLLPLLLRMSSAVIENAASQLTLFQWYGLLAAAALGLLLLPAFAMGAGFPLILAAAGNRSEQLGNIYGLNTLGAACGALLPLWLLPTLGWSGAVRIVACIGILVAASFLLIATRCAQASAKTAEGELSRPPWRALLAYAGIGTASLILEIGWTRLFGMVMLRTEYVLAVILAAYLLGIGAGSMFAPRGHKRVWFMVLPIIACGFALLSLWLLPTLSGWVERTEFETLFGALTMQGLMLALLTLPVTLVMGAWLPLLNLRFQGGGMWLYGANSLGAAAGAALAGAILIPLWGSAATIVVAALLFMVMGLTWSHQRMAWLALPVAIAAAFPVWKLPPVSALLPNAEAGSKNLYVYEDAVSITHVVERSDGQRLLLTDLQRMDASSDPTAVFVQSNQARLPLLLNGNPHSVLFLGLGTGISVAGSLPFPNLQRTAVELSQGSINAAARWFTPVNHDAMKHTKVWRDDAKHFLSAAHKKYDVIIGDVFHPDLAGMSSLLSLEQFTRARNDLTGNGLFVQWLALNQFDIGSLRVVLRTFRKAFPDAQLFLDGMHLALVGPKQRFTGAAGLLHNLHRMTPHQQEAATAGEGGWTWLGRYWGPIPDSSGAIQDEWSPVIEYRLPRARYAGGLDVLASLRMLLQIRPDMRHAEVLLGVRDADKENFERAYAASELMVRSWLADMQGDAPQANRLISLAYQANPQNRWVQYAMADSMFSSIAQARSLGLSKEQALRRILRVNPRHVEALRALWKLQRNAGDEQAAKTRVRLLQLSPLDREARAAEN